MPIDATSALTAQHADTPVARQERQAAASLATAGHARALKNLPQSEQVKAVAGQFEAILLRQFLQDSVSKIMGGEESGPSGNVYGYMLTDVLASKLSEGGGLGLAKVIQKQLTPRTAHSAGAQNPTP